MTSRYFAISRQAYYTWVRRYETERVDGLPGRSKRPRTSSNGTRAEVLEKIVRLRNNYHFGPEKIQMSLKRHHDITISKSGCGAFSTAWTWVEDRHPSATSATTAAGNATRSSIRGVCLRVDHVVGC